MNNYEFFWSGPFSQWYPSVFHCDGVKFYTAEQYMMVHKAILFKDLKMINKILKTKNPREQKALGRKVANFDANKWNNKAKEIVERGNYCKFSQNKDLKKILLDTYPKILVEASPYDKIWGIGLNEDDALRTKPENWPGTNWLGIVLTKVRNNILLEGKT